MSALLPKEDICGFRCEFPTQRNRETWRENRESCTFGRHRRRRTTMKGTMLKSLRGLFAVLSVVVSSGFAAPAGAQDTIKVAVGPIDAWANQVPTLGMKAGIFQKHGIVLENYGTQGAGETL